MADIPSAPVKVNDVEVAQDAPLTESLMNKIGASLNYLIDHISDYTAVRLRYQTFSSSGSWVAPSNTSQVLVIGCGGGGGGGGGPGSNTQSRGGEGGGGAPIMTRYISVTPGGSHTVTIGSGGAGGAPAANGSVGTSSSFNGFTFRGGGAGRAGPVSDFFNPTIADYLPFATRTTYFGPTAAGTAGGSGGGATAPADGLKGQASAWATGGNGGLGQNFGGNKSGGGGGGASIGSGGTGGNGGVDNATAGSTGAGGGGGCTSSPQGGAGASGGSGQITVVWVQ